MTEKIFAMLDLFYATKHLYEKIKKKRGNGYGKRKYRKN